MKKKLIIMSAVSVAIAFLAPLILIQWIGELGSSVIVMLGLYPALCVGMGIAAGISFRQLWFYPVIPPVLMAVALFAFFGGGWMEILQMCMYYVMMGAIPMGIAASVKFLFTNRKG